jgi:hypothetical protein
MTDFAVSPYCETDVADRTKLRAWLVPPFLRREALRHPLTKAERYRIQLISTLADEDVRWMGMTPARTLTDALANIDARVEGYVLPRGAALLPVIRD